MALSGASADDRSWNAAGRHDFESDSRTELGILRLETKLDGFMQVQALRDDAILKEVKYMRDTFVTTSTDHEARIRTLEGKRYVEPRTVWTAFSILSGVGSLIVAIVNILTR